jgi:hypothetical protein
MTTHNNIMCNLNYNPSGLHHYLVHRFYHGLARTITLLFFVIFGHYQNFKQWCQIFIFQHWTTLLYQMKHNGKLNNFSKFFSYHPMCQLGINSLLVVKCKCFLVLGMLTNLGIKLVLFFHIRPHTPHNFLTTYMFTKGIPISNKYFFLPFYPNTNLAFDNVQGSIFPCKQFCPWEFCKPYFLELSCYIIVPFLDA